MSGVVLQPSHTYVYTFGKHDGTVKMANLLVASVSDRRDRLSRLSVTDGTGRRLLKHDGTDGTQKKRSKNA